MPFKAEALAGVLLLLFAACVALIGWSLPPDELGGDGPIYYFHSIGVGSFVFDLPSFISSNRAATNTLMWIAGTTAASGMAILIYSAIRMYRQSRKTPMATQQAVAKNET